VHLAGKTDGRDVFGDETRSLQSFVNRESRGAPPVARVLLGPAGLRAGEIGVFLRAGGEDCAVFVEDYGASAACAYVDPEDWNTASFLLTQGLPQELFPTRCRWRKNNFQKPGEESGATGFRERSRRPFKTSGQSLSTCYTEGCQAAQRD
jgi:hypothetical protein